MKLVDILARELDRWPEGMSETVGQGHGGYLHGYTGDGHPNCQRTRKIFTVCDDYEYEKVTRAQWQEAREALSKPAKPVAPMPPISEAPKDATHWDPGIKCTPSWARLDGDQWFWWPVSGAPIDIGWRPYAKQAAAPDTFIAIEKAWNGEGLPPVGEYCEASMLYGEWAKGLVIAHHFDGAVVAVGDDERGFEYDSYQTNQVRPVRTPEQIAAEEREKFIEECREFASVTSNIRDVFAMMYDAGYRQVNDGNQGGEK